MAETLKILGQAAPSATTETTLYTVPPQKAAIISTISVSNRAATSATFRLSVSAYSAATTNKDYITYDETLAANDTINFTLGLTVQSSSIIRVYASSANLSFSAYGTESDLTIPIDGYMAWYDAADSTTITLNGSDVSQWDDKSANGYHVSQGTASNQPAYTGTRNGKNVITFDPAGPELLTNTSTGTIAQPFTTFAVAYPNNTGAGKTMVYASTSTGSRHLLTIQQPEYLQANMGTALNGTTNTLYDALLQFSTLINSTSSYVYVNGTQEATGNAGSSSLTAIRIGANHTPAFGFSGDVAEILIYNSALDTTQRTAVEKYLKTKWGTP